MNPGTVAWDDAHPSDQSAGTWLQRARARGGDAEATDSTARLLCPKKALNRTNRPQPNYSGSGRKGKPLEVRIKFPGRE